MAKNTVHHVMTYGDGFVCLLGIPNKLKKKKWNLCGKSLVTNYKYVLEHCHIILVSAFLQHDERLTC